METKGPGKAHRDGISLIELTDLFPDEASAAAWFESLVWPEGRHCPRCGNTETAEAADTAGLPYWCGACRKGFSVRIGTALERSKVPLRKWVFAIYLEMTSLKGVSSMKLHRDIKVTQRTAWFLLHRIREAWTTEIDSVFSGPVEVDETYVGGRRKNMPKAKRKALTGRGAVGKAIVVGAKDRATHRVSAAVVETTDKPTLQGFVIDRTADGATVLHRRARCLSRPALRPSDRQSRRRRIRPPAGPRQRHGELLGAPEARLSGHLSPHLSAKHLNRYVATFAARHNVRESDTIDQMAGVVSGMVGKRLMYKDLTA